MITIYYNVHSKKQYTMLLVASQCPIFTVRGAISKIGMRPYLMAMLMRYCWPKAHCYMRVKSPPVFGNVSPLKNDKSSGDPWKNVRCCLKKRHWQCWSVLLRCWLTKSNINFICVGQIAIWSRQINHILVDQTESCLPTITMLCWLNPHEKLEWILAHQRSYKEVTLW